MKIQSIETIPVRLPTRRVHQWANLKTPIGVYLLVKLTTDDGWTAWARPRPSRTGAATTCATTARRPPPWPR